MIREWANGRRGLSPLYADLLVSAFKVPMADTGDAPTTGADEELADRLAYAQSAVDLETVGLFEDQTQNLRLLDRRLGAARILAQAEAHVSQMSETLAYCLLGPVRTALGRAVAEAAALAGWQALDLGYVTKCWSLHEVAKSAAQESKDPAVIAHVTAQQAYALLDLDRPADAILQIAHVREHNLHSLPPTMQAWIWAAEAEARAAGGDAKRSLQALDYAAAAVPDQSDPELPYLSLDETHLARWRGHCMARIGADEAVTNLLTAVASHDPTFARAAAGLHTDLAFAYASRQEWDAAQASARTASRLAGATSSARQKKRLAKLARQALAGLGGQ